jgi:nitrogen fixation protein NifU and related proteins
MLDRNSQIELLLEHNNNPCCRARLPDANVAMPGGNPGCGDVVTIYLKAGRPEGSGDNAPERIQQASFLGSGCTISQAAASMLMEMLQEEKPSLEEILEMSYEDMMEMLGREVVSSRPRCATLALGTLKAAVRKHQRDQQRRAAGLPVEDITPEEMEPFEAS